MKPNFGGRRGDSSETNLNADKHELLTTRCFYNLYFVIKINIFTNNCIHEYNKFDIRSSQNYHIMPNIR